MGELVTIAEFDQWHEAQVLRTRLEAEGIATFLLNENLNSLLPTGSFTRVKLQVRLNDSLRAVDILYDQEEDSAL